MAVQDASDGFVINLGDLMARWTNDRWLSTPHRVVNPADGEAARARRQSLAYFVNVNMDADIECIPTCHGDDGSKYPTIKAGEHLLTKHQQTVAGKLCYEAAARDERSPVVDADADADGRRGGVGDADPDATRIEESDSVCVTCLTRSACISARRGQAQHLHSLTMSPLLHTAQGSDSLYTRSSRECDPRGPSFRSRHVMVSL